VTLEGLCARVKSDLTQVEFALVGGLAVGARTEPRFTADLDLAVIISDDQQAEQLLRYLMSRGYHLTALVEQTWVGRLATARVRLNQSAPILDLLFASSGIEVETVTGAEPLEIFPGLVIPVADIPHLIALKVLARDDDRREQDRGDLRRLIGKANATQLDVAQSLLARIEERGFHRGKALQQLFQRALTEFGKRKVNP